MTWRIRSLAPALKAFAVWLLILACAVVNGAFREGVLAPRFGPVVALVASGLLLCACILGVSAALVPWFGRLRARQYGLVGLFWLVFTLGFEFGFGRLFQHKTWPQLFEAYTFDGGNLWPAVLFVTALAPWAGAHWRGLLTAPPK